jgi:hypothetical protein
MNKTPSFSPLRKIGSDFSTVLHRGKFIGAPPDEFLGATIF